MASQLVVDEESKEGPLNRSSVEYQEAPASAEESTAGEDQVTPKKRGRKRTMVEGEVRGEEVKKKRAGSMDRPSRERKSVERYAALSPIRGSVKTLAIQQGSGEKLKDIPNALGFGKAITSPVNRGDTWEGCSVLLDINDGDRLVFARLSSGATLKIGNKKFSLRPLIGFPFGSLFRVEIGPSGSHLARCFPSFTADGNAATVKDKDSLHASGEAKDNRSLFDNNTAQSLSSEDIDALKREGATGDEIVEALIANSSTFEKKTALSQEKYKVKKQKKYAPKVLLRRPCSRSICEAYFKKYPSRIGSLRIDALCLLLSMANVGAYSDVLVFDMVGGLLTGAVAERLGGTGYVCSTHFGTSRNLIDIVRMFNFCSEVNSRIVQASFNDLCIVRENDGYNNTTFLAESVPPKGSMHVLEEEEEEAIQEINVSSDRLCSSHEISNTKTISQSSPLIDSNPAIEDDEEGSNVSSPAKKLITPGRQASLEVVSSWKERGFSSLIVAAPELEVGSLVERLLPLLSYSAPFAIYNHCLQPLAMCMHKLQISKMAINLQISEPWLREYQVLPSRTHPHMQMNAFGGYILSGIRICSEGKEN